MGPDPAVAASSRNCPGASAYPRGPDPVCCSSAYLWSVPLSDPSICSNFGGNSGDNLHGPELPTITNVEGNWPDRRPELDGLDCERRRVCLGPSRRQLSSHCQRQLWRKVGHTPNRYADSSADPSQAQLWRSSEILAPAASCCIAALHFCKPWTFFAVAVLRWQRRQERGDT
jgi:hypothetical protein